MTTQRTIVFDLDETFADTLRDLISALNRTLAKSGLPPFALSDVAHLTGKVEGACSEKEVAHALPLFRKAFPNFCEKHGVKFSDYAAFLVRFISGSVGNSYVVTIQDCGGRRSSREYVGSEGKRSEMLDELGRCRPKNLNTPLD